jgi:hypothetical protein
MVKTESGNALSRIMWGGVRLSLLERSLLIRLVSELPSSLRTIVETQFLSYNLAQREIDGRAVKFYRKWLTRLGGTTPLLEMTTVEAPLIRLAFEFPGDAVEHHAVLTAVHGRTFCMTFDQDIRPLASRSEYDVTHVTHSWRSNFRVRV